MDALIIGFAVIIVICVILSARNAHLGKGHDVKVQFVNSETGRTVHVGHGNSIGSAIEDGFSKMWNSVSISTREDTIKSKLDSMTSTLSDNRSRMTKCDIAQCEQYVSYMRDLLAKKQAERQHMEREQKEINMERKRQKAEKSAELARQQLEKEKALSERQHYIAEQRRLVTASVRYEVMRRDHFRCVLCGSTAQNGTTLHVDHIIPLAKGGTSEMANLRTLCDRCNLGKGTKIE